MSGKQSKKIRQLARRAIAAELPTADEIAERYRLQIRPVPRWCPARVWYWLAHRFLQPIDAKEGS